MNYREAIQDDLPALIALLFDDHLGKKREDPNNLSLYAKALETITADPNHQLIIAIDRNQIVGMLQLSFFPGLTFQGAWRAQIEGVRVRKNLRGKGIGKALLEEALTRAKARHCRLVQLTTNKSRPQAAAFYQRLGFIDSHIGMKLDLAP